MSMNDLRYPIGRFAWPETVSPEDRARHIETIAARARAPARCSGTGFSEKQLDTPYREGGWTVRQVVHHVPESHMNSYIRFKLALTEDEPVIKPYDEAAWARLPDVATAPVETSLKLLDALHERWVVLLGASMKRTGRKPSGIPRADRFRSKRISRSTRGTAITTSRTFSLCGDRLSHKTI